MLTHALDTPYDLPAQMAFAVDPHALAELRGALRALVELGNAAPMRSLRENCAPQRLARHFNTRYRGDAASVRALCKLVRRLARRITDADPELAIDLEPAMTSTERGLHDIDTVELTPQVWMTIAGARNLEQDIELLLDEGAEFMAAAQVSAIAEGLASIFDGTPPPESFASDTDLSWLSSLRFRRAGELAERARPSGQNDIAVGTPEGSDDLGPTALDVLYRTRRAVGLWGVLESIVGPWTWSDGPGPFLPQIAIAKPIEVPTWERLPIFDVDHWAWPFCKGHVLEGDDLRLAVEATTTAKPSRRCLAERGGDIDAKAWKEIVRDHWPRCRSRFLALLSRAHQGGQAVLLLDGDRSHPQWYGVERPVEVRQE